MSKDEPSAHSEDSRNEYRSDEHKSRKVVHSFRNTAVVDERLGFLRVSSCDFVDRPRVSRKKGPRSHTNRHESRNSIILMRIWLVVVPAQPDESGPAAFSSKRMNLES